MSPIRCEVFRTDRLVARQMNASDLVFMSELLGDPAVMRYWPRPQTAEEAEAWITKQLDRYARGGTGYWLLEDSRTGEPLGQAGLFSTDVEGTRIVDIGYILARHCWGRGLGREAGTGCIRYAYQVLGVERVHALIRPENEPSVRVATELGMKPGPLVEHGGYPHILFSRDLFGR